MNRLRQLITKITVVIAALTLAVLAAVEGPAGATVSGCCRPVGTSGDQSMVFTRNVNGVKQVFKADQNLTHVVQLTSGNVDNSMPSINSARTLIAYTSLFNKRQALFVMNADGSNQHNVTNDMLHDYWSPSISRDGTKAVVVSNRNSGYELYVVNLSTGAQTQLTFLNSVEQDNWAPAWSPNGQYIAFTSDRAHVVNIYVMPAGGGSAQRVTYDGAADNAAWSPNGQSIAYDFLAPGTSVREVYWADAFSVNVVHKVSTTDGAGHFDPTWSPDGSSVAFTSADSTGPSVKAAGADGSNQHSLLAGGFMANWGFPIQAPTRTQ